MRQVKIDENGNVVDISTGEVVAVKSGNGMVTLKKPQQDKDDGQGEHDNAANASGHPMPEQQNRDGGKTDGFPEWNASSADNRTSQDTAGSGICARPVPKADGARPSITKYEVTPESEFTVRFCIGFREGRPIIYREDAHLSSRELEPHWARFRMWTFEEALKWRAECTSYDQMTHATRLDTAKFDELKMRNLLKDWSFAAAGEKFKPLHVNGFLSDESWNVVKGLFPSISSHIVRLMNSVLEENG